MKFKTRLKKFSGILAIAVAVAAFMSFTPFAAQATEGDDDAPPVFVSGIIPEEFELTYPLPPRTRSLPPTSYDSRDNENISSVKNQGPNGLCWAFATYAAAEANRKMSSGGEPDFSELHMAYATSTANGNTEQGFANRPSPGESGGNRSVAAAYLMRGTNLSGAVNESDDSYAPYTNADVPNRALSVTQEKPRSFTVKNILYISGSEKPEAGTVTQIKNAIMNYGAVGASMYWGSSTPTGNAGAGNTAYYNAANRAYYYDESTLSESVPTQLGTNHGVLIVGWDDEFDKNKFNSSKQPTGNGAWLVKNSWGTGWGDGGYFWISYEDTNFPLSTYAIDGVVPYDEDETTYEYDYLGTNGTAGGYSGTNYYARVFTAEIGAEALGQVKVFLPNANLTVSVDVIPDFDNDGFAGYTFTPNTSKTFSYPGAYTIDLDTPVMLGEKGSRFAVMVEISGATGTSRISFNSVSASSGTSYLFNPNSGGSWGETTTNYCIKAVTLPVPTYAVTYNLNGGTGTPPTETDKPAGAEFTAMPDEGITAPEGKVFVGWNTKSDGSGDSYAAGGQIIMPPNSLVLYAIYEVAPTYGVTLSETAYSFDDEIYGYSTIAAQEITITNIGNRPTGPLFAALSGANAASFTLSPASISSIAVDGEASFTVAPNEGLAVGDYSATVTVSGSNSISESFTVAFAVTAKGLTVNVAVKDKVYDGNNTAELNGTPTLVGLVEGDEGSVTLSYGTPTFSVFDSPAANIPIEFSAEFAISGTKASNYTLTQPGVFASITAVLPVYVSVTYDDNGSTSGTVPTDSTAYTSGATVTVAGNTGSLARTGYIFAGWNTAANGSGTSYAAGATFSITANTTLYAEWVLCDHSGGLTVTAATCTLPGSRVGCSICQASVNETIAALGHNFIDNWTQTSAATCTAANVESRSCTRNCDEAGNTETRSTIAALGHDFVAYSTPATCVEDGRSWQACSRCSVEAGSTVIPQLGHDWGEWTTDDPTADPIEYTRVCLRLGCGASETVKVDNKECKNSSTGKHDFNSEVIEILTPATCIAQGSGRVYCVNGCGEFIPVTIPTTAHSFGAWTTTKAALCEADGEETRNCLTPSCLAYETRLIKATGHSYSSYTGNTATCTAGGTETATCTKCGATVSRATVALGHNYVNGFCTRCNAPAPNVNPGGNGGNGNGNNSGNNNSNTTSTPPYRDSANYSPTTPSTANPATKAAAGLDLNHVTVTGKSAGATVIMKSLVSLDTYNQLVNEANALFNKPGLAAAATDGAQSGKVFGAFAVNMNTVPVDSSGIITINVKMVAGKNKLIAVVRNKDGSTQYAPVDVGTTNQTVSIWLPGTAESVVLMEYRPTRMTRPSSLKLTNTEKKRVFDAKYYAAHNPDVVKAVGTKSTALYNHYLRYGLREGRAGSATFDISYYRLSNPDLQAAFGNDTAAYVRHYLKYGRKEGRLAGVGK